MGRAHRIVLADPPDQVAAFFRRYPDLLDDKSETRMTPLMVCLDDGRSQTARILIELGAAVNLTDRYGQTALMYAAQKGLADIASLLLKNGADVNASDTADGFTAMDWAIVCKQEEVIAILRRAGGLAKELDDRKAGV